MKYLLRLSVIVAVLATIVSCGQKKSDMDKFIDDLMGRMSIDQKIGQLNLLSAGGFKSADKVNTDNENIQMLRQGLVGGIYGSSSREDMMNAQKIALESPDGIPLLFGLDVIHGHQTAFPIPLALSTSWNLEMIERSARIAAAEATAEGINWVFSPMVDIARDARWGRIAEGAGEDPYLGGEIAKVMVWGYQGRDGDLSRDDNLLSCVKHYALYGGAEAGRDYNTVDMSRQTMYNVYLRPYQQACYAGAGSYMSSFNEIEGIPATANHFLLTELLRDQWGFDGFVVSDATAVMEVTRHGLGDLQEASALAIQAGLDMDMNSSGFVGTFKKSLKEGRISEADIDRACRRVLEAKYKLGLFDDPYKYFKPERTSEVYTAENKAFARELAGECQVLLKNEGGLLPLKKDARVLVVGPLADKASEMTGCWAMTSHASECVTILDGIRDAVSSKGKVSFAEGSWLMNDKEMEQRIRNGRFSWNKDEKIEEIHGTPKQVLLAEALLKASMSDVIVACLGEIQLMNGEGASRSDISIPDAQAELLRALKATGKPVVLVVTAGRPLTLTWEEENIPAILYTWNLGTEAGHAIADVLFGDVNPSAKLTTSFPRNVGQIPVYYNHKNTGRPFGDYDQYSKFKSNYMDVINAPLYPFGYGLSYTTYKYGPTTLSASQMRMDGSVTVSVDVTNTGDRDGKEIVQLYLHDVYSTMTRPVKELIGFKKVDIKAGETVTVEFQITADDLKYYNHELEYVCEPGDFEIMTGPSSAEVTTAVLTVK